MFGSFGDDKLWGGNGYDILYGGEGNDILFGGTGFDRLFGGIGCDIFEISAFEQGTAIIKDIEACDTLKINVHESCDNNFVFEGEALNALTDSFTN